MCCAKNIKKVLWYVQTRYLVGVHNSQLSNNIKKVHLLLHSPKQPHRHTSKVTAHLCSTTIQIWVGKKVEQSHYRPMWPRGFWSVKAPDY